MIVAGHNDLRPRSPGRPREFEINAALDEAIIVFTERGYHGTSIADLREAMGLTSGSLYKAFKDKKSIFLAAFDRYKQVRNAALEANLSAGMDGRDKIRRMLLGYAEASIGETGRRGCLVVMTATELALSDPNAADRVARSNAALEDRFRTLIAEGLEDGSIRPGLDPVATARSLLCIVQGMRVVAKADRSDEVPMAVVSSAMKLLD